jgi:HEAT repeat protein
LKESDRWVRISACRSLARFGPEARSIIPKLSEALKDQDSDVKIAAALSLWMVEGKPETAVAVLISLLRPSSSVAERDTPHAAADALAEMGATAKEAIPKLLATLRNKDQSLRIRGARALWKITGQTEPSLAVLIKAIGDEERVEDLDPPVLPILKEMGPRARDALPILRMAEKRASDDMKIDIRATIKRIESDTPSKPGAP